MDLFVLDENLDALTVVDTYESLIWTDRYRECGDFELYLPISEGIFDYLKDGYYLQTMKSEHTMIIEKIYIQSDVENGNHVTVSGRSVESILDRRIIWGRLTVSGNLQNGVKQILDLCIINPENENRRIENFVFEYSDDPAIVDLELDAQYTGDCVYDIINKICIEYGLGFKITVNENNQFVFKLYSGSDRSYNQTLNPYVIFSPAFDNIINSNYVESKSALKNVALIAGEGEGSARKFAYVGEEIGLDRREVFVDARDVSSDTSDGGKISDSEYYILLMQRGIDKLSESTGVVSFEGEAETSIMFKYGEDFFIGDIVQIANEYGHETTARITELVISEDESGSSMYPTFENMEGDNAL